MKNLKILLLAFSCLIFSLLVFSCKKNDGEVSTLTEDLSPSALIFKDNKINLPIKLPLLKDL